MFDRGLPGAPGKQQELSNPGSIKLESIYLPHAGSWAPALTAESHPPARPIQTPPPLSPSLTKPSLRAWLLPGPRVTEARPHIRETAARLLEIREIHIPTSCHLFDGVNRAVTERKRKIGRESSVCHSMGETLRL